MTTFIITWAFRLLGPLWAVARPYVPAVSALKSFAAGAVLLAVAAAGAWLVWHLRDSSESAAIADKAQAIVDRANLKSENAALKAATEQQAATLKEREQAIETSTTELEKLKKEMEKIRDASPNPDDVVIPAGDPWLVRSAGGLPKRP